MNKREEQKEQRKKQILNAALDLFIRKGYGETKIADIAKAAEMSMGLMFHYYDSKEKLYEELIEIGYEKLHAEGETVIESPIHFFREMAQQNLCMITNNPFAAKMFVLMDQAQYKDSISPEIKNKLKEADQLSEQLAAIIVQGQKMGEIREGDPKALAVAFWSSIQGIASYLVQNPDSPCPEAEWIVSIIKK